jgi:transcriptional regulator with XRE-family HTH domain
MGLIISLTTDKHFGEQLRSERKRLKLSQIELGKRMGCTGDNICHFEKGDNTFGNGSIQTVFKYAKALGYDEVNFKL